MGAKWWYLYDKSIDIGGLHLDFSRVAPEAIFRRTGWNNKSRCDVDLIDICCRALAGGTGGLSRGSCIATRRN